MIQTIFTFIGVLAVLVLAHELGHFMMARKFGVKVSEFGIGFPPRIWGWRRGETLYSLNLVPLGGFVRIKGEAGEHVDDEDSFAHKPVWQRSLILVAGVAMNFLLAWFLLSAGFMWGLPQVVDDLPDGARVAEHKVQIMNVLPEAPAAKAGLQFGDAILSINGEEIATVGAVQQKVGSSGGETLTFDIRRGGEQQTVEITPLELTETGGYGVGVALVESGIVSYPWYSAVVRGLEAAAIMTKEIVIAFYQLIHNLLSGGGVSMDVSGPVGIAVLTGQVARLGFIYLLQFAAMLSINLAVINILPFPALDGGRLLFVLAEKIRRGRGVNRRLEAVIHNIGFLLLIFLVITVTYHDILRYSSQIIAGVKGLFS